jgi:hypothetical protein
MKQLVFLFLFSNLAYGQLPFLEWSVRSGADYDDYPRSLCTDADGNTYIAGSFKGTGDFDPGTNVLNFSGQGQEDVFIQKLDPNGNLIWAYSMGSANIEYAAEMILTEDEEHIYLTGYFWGTSFFSTNGPNYTLNAIGANSMFIMKMDTAATIEWIKIAEFGASDIAVDEDDNIYLAGNQISSAEYDPGPGTVNLVGPNITIVKLDSLGIFQHVQEMDIISGNPQVTNLIYEDGALYLSGFLDGEVDFDPSVAVNSITSLGDYDGYIVKVDTAGNHIWSKHFGATGNQYINGMDVDGNGKIVAAGFHDASFDIDPNAGVQMLTSVHGDDAFNMGLDTAGNLLWVSTISGLSNDRSHHVVIDNLGNSYCLSWVTNEVTVSDGSNTISPNFLNSNSYHNLLTKYNANGDLLSSFTMSGEAFYGGRPLGVNSNQELFVTGWLPGIYHHNGVYEEYQNPSSPIGGIVVKKFIQCSSNLTPAITNLPTLNAECQISPSPPSASSGCGDNILTTSDFSFPITSQGATTITWTHMDNYGNTISQTQDVVIDDITAPVPVLPFLPDTTFECNHIPVPPQATDNCVGNINGTPDVYHSFGLPQGTTTVIWTYHDQHGNSTQQFRNYTYTPIDSSIVQNGNTLTALATGYTYSWVDCNNGNTPIPGETGQSLTMPDPNGSYAVEISNGECSVISNCIGTPSSIFQEENAEIKIYPNPVESFIYIEGLPTSSTSIYVSDLSGKVVMSKIILFDTVLDVSSLEPGLYLLNLVRQHSQSNYSFVKI